MKLFHIVTLILVSLFTAGCAGTTITNRATSPFIQRMNSSTVALVAMNVQQDKVQPYCTGVWVGHKKIVTAAHCIKIMAKHTAALHEEDTDLIDALDLEGTKIHFSMFEEIHGIGLEPYTMHLGTATKVDMDEDLALVEADGDAVPQHEIAELASQSPGIGEKVFIVGHTKGMYYTYLEGVVSAYRSELSEYTGTKGQLMQVSCSASHGNSGGGAFDSRGKLVGIADALMPIPNAVVFIHAETIRKFLAPKEEKIAPLKAFVIPPV